MTLPGLLRGQGPGRPGWGRGPGQLHSGCRDDSGYTVSPAARRVLVDPCRETECLVIRPQNFDQVSTEQNWSPALILAEWQ